jgi:hypothetical protein
VTQLSLDDAVDRPNPNAHLFDADGKPRRLLWCSDSARLGGPCPYDDPARARFAPDAIGVLAAVPFGEPGSIHAGELELRDGPAGLKAPCVRGLSNTADRSNPAVSDSQV